MARMLRIAKYFAYLAVAGGLGALWYAALLIPRVTRALLVKDAPRPLILLVAISIVLALLTKRCVLGPLDPERAAMVAILTPLAGSVLFVGAITLLGSLFDPTGGPQSVAGWLGALLLLGVGTVVAVFVSAFYVVIPLGLLSLYVMRKVGKVMWREPSGI